MVPRRLPHRQRRRPPLGQHFLEDARIRGRILELLSCKQEDCWLEIGPGHGEITAGLAENSRSTTVVERDHQLAEKLRTSLGSLAGVRVVEADILKVSVQELARQMSCNRVRIYGSLPYYITSPILHLLFPSLAVIADIHIVVQREVAERLVASPGGRDYGYLSVVTQFHTTPELLLKIPRGAFRPPPQVDSALVSLAPPGASTELNVGNPNGFLRFVSACFRHKRKTLQNNLRGVVATEQVQRVVAEVGLKPHVRAEEVSLDKFARLYKGLSAGPGSVGAL